MIAKNIQENFNLKSSMDYMDNNFNNINLNIQQTCSLYIEIKKEKKQPNSKIMLYRTKKPQVFSVRFNNKIINQ
jgi:hypothetical protein